MSNFPWLFFFFSSSRVFGVHVASPAPFGFYLLRPLAVFATAFWCLLYVPGFSQPYVLTLLDMQSGLFWNAFMVDRTSLFFIANWDTAQMNLEEVEGHCNSMANILRQLVKESNWDRKISEVFGC